MSTINVNVKSDKTWELEADLMRFRAKRNRYRLVSTFGGGLTALGVLSVIAGVWLAVWSTLNDVDATAGCCALILVGMFDAIVVGGVSLCCLSALCDSSRTPPKIIYLQTSERLKRSRQEDTDRFLAIAAHNERGYDR